MINVNDNFKIDIRTYGRQFDVQLKANNTDISSDDLNYLKPSFNTSLFKTVMHQIEIDSKLYMPADTKITGKIGVKVNEKTYNYINLNNYYVKSCERQEDTNSYRILAYTKMKESMIDYDLTLTEKITVRNYLIKICQRLGWNTSNIPATFINSEKLVDPSLHTGINYSFRDALDELATITCSFFMFKGDEFYLLYLTETNESIDETYLDEDNITIGEKYIINSLVFSRAEESDNIFRKDDTSIATNGLHEYRISDCQLLSTNDRSDYIDEMFNYLKTLSFYIFDVQSKGILFLEACDIFNFVLNEVTYKTILLNNEIELDDGLTEKLYTDEPEETETEYKYADSTDKKINQAYILVDKQNKKITQLTEETTENSEKITKVEQDVNGVATKVSSVEKSVENITNTEGEATGKNIHLEDSSDEELVSIKVKGETNQATRSGKNKFNIFDENWRIYNGIKQSDGSIKANVKEQYYISLQNTSDYWKNYIMQNKGKTLTFSQKEVIAGYGIAIVIYGDRTSTTSGYQVIESSPSTRSTSLTIADDFTSVSRVELRILRKQPVTTFTDTTTVITELQLEEGLVATPYTPYQEQKVTFPLAEGQKLMGGSYLASDGIHNKRKQVVFDGSDDESWAAYTVTSVDGYAYYTKAITDCKIGFNTSICSHFKNKNYAWDVGKIGEYSDHPTLTYKYFVTDKASITDWKLWLSQNPITIEYELLEEEIIPYTAEQQEAWNKIEHLHTYKNITNIFSDAELDIVYVRDNGLSDMYETKQNANKNYTKTIKKIAEQKITTDEITQKVSSLEETTVKKIQVQYALSDSQITAPTGAWNTTAPEWQTGKYMWQKTVTIYSNGTTIESEPTCIQGAKGETGTSGANGKDGKDGEKGKGVKSIQDQYYLSTSNTTQTGGNWKNTQDSWESGKYIWTRSHITWSDDTTTNTTPILAQGLNKANETANNTKENLENNYSTTVEMNAAISTKADEITSEVNKKVNEVDLGTKIEQNYEHVKLAWNQISEFIQLMILNKNASLAILDKNQKVMMALDKEGQHFYETDGNTIFGDMGVQKEDDKQYIAFSVLSEYAQKISNGMAWGIKTKSDNIFHPIFYIKNFEMSDKNSDSSYGELVLNSCNMILEGLSTGIISGNIKMYGDIANNSIQFINTDTEDILLSISASDLETGYPKLKILNNISFFQNEGGANSFKLGNGDNSCLLTDDGEITAKTISADNIVNSEDIYNISGAANSFLYANFRGGGSVYLYTTSSDKELKKNIKKTNVNAIELIQRIKHREFDWKKNNQHQKIGYVAQEMQKIDENFVYHTKFKAENGEIKEDWQINVLSVLATATKAIQEQQKQIEKMQKEIDELKSKEV